MGAEHLRTSLGGDQPHDRCVLTLPQDGWANAPASAPGRADTEDDRDEKQVFPPSSLRQTEEVNPLAWLVPAALTGGAAAVSFFSSRRAWAAIDTPTIATGNVVIGRVEVAGKAGPGPSGTRVVSPITAQTCVWWSVEVEEETGSGKDKSWKTRHQATSEPAITVDDGSGPIIVDLTGTSISSPETNVIKGDDAPPSLTANALTAIALGEPFLPATSEDDRGFFDRLHTGWDTDTPITSLTGTWRISETYVPEGSDIYVFGSTTFDEERHAAVFVKAKDRPLYVYSGTEGQLTKNARRLMIVSALAMLALACLTVAVFTGSTYVKPDGKEGIHPNWSRGPIGPTVLLLAMFVVQVIRIRNRIVTVREQYQAAHRLVDIAEKKRSTLVPQLTAVVSAAAAHEREVQESVASLRGRDLDAENIAAIAEASPSLKTNENFLQLQRALTDVENDLAVARGFVADSEAVYKTRVQSFPDSLIAPWLGIDIDGSKPGGATRH